MDVHTTDSISKTLSIHQGRFGSISVDSEASNLHLELVEEAEGEKVRLYVPQDQSRFGMCLATELPSRLLQIFSVAPNAAAGIISILMSKQLSVIDHILESTGIINIEGVDRPEEDWADSVTISESIEVIDAQTGVATYRRTEDHLQPQVFTQRFTASNRSERSASLTPSSGGIHSTPGTSVSDIPDSQDLEDNLFNRFLTAVVDGARSLQGVPICDQSNISNATATLMGTDEVESAVASSRKPKIGAAGELYVNQSQMLCR
jgi:hypothetical protein